MSKYLPNSWKSDFQIGYFGQIEKKLDLQLAGSSPNLTYTKIGALDAIRIL